MSRGRYGTQTACSKKACARGHSRYFDPAEDQASEAGWTADNSILMPDLAELAAPLGARGLPHLRSTKLVLSRNADDSHCTWAGDEMRFRLSRRQAVGRKDLPRSPWHGGDAFAARSPAPKHVRASFLRPCLHVAQPHSAAPTPQGCHAASLPHPLPRQTSSRFARFACLRRS